MSDAAFNLATLTSLNGPAEIRLHVKGALDNGVTVAEIQAVVLHTPPPTV